MMYHKLPKAIIFDLDGTIAESKQVLTEETGALIAELTNKTVVAIASGAGFAQFERQFLSSLPSNAKLDQLYLLPVNAAQLYRHEHGDWVALYDESFTRFEREKILTAFEEALKDSGLPDEKNQLYGARIEDRAAQITFSALGQDAPVDKKSLWDPTAEKRQRIREALLPRLPEFSIAIGGMTSIDVTRSGIDKAYGVERLADETGVRITDMLYIGDALFDGGNDAVVKRTGIATREIKNTEETRALIRELVQLPS